MDEPQRYSLALPPRLADQLARELTLALAAVWLACVLALAWYVSHIVHHNFDQEMIDSGHRLLEVAVHQLEQEDHSREGVQRPHVASQPGDEAEDLVYQLQDGRGNVLLRTQAAPVAAFAVPMREGFYEREGWRIYVVAHPRQPLFLMLADPMVERSEALQRALLALGSVMLVMLALMGWALRVTARRRLRVLRDMQLQLSERGGSNLEPLDLDAMPRELWRLGRGINHLMQRLSHALQVERSMAANAAHELRTPLAVATLRLQTALDRGVDNTDVRAAYEALERLRQRTESCCSCRARPRARRWRRTRCGWTRWPAWWPPSSGSRTNPPSCGWMWCCPSSPAGRWRAMWTRWPSPCATWWRTRCATAMARRCCSKSATAAPSRCATRGRAWMRRR